ncbi:F-type ATPase subunit b [Luteitalea pratensis]|uniref:ATP synthase subunit b n=1 Tax=Luteitalea pratensis TaxID=1855912 RepID=A0A143PZ31_LUTPR|nr:ATP synthase F0 subunit B [Luteitalea pratensis]AMY13029.1 F-type ATPase subunit b [Luteitalea pratensis]
MPLPTMGKLEHPKTSSPFVVVLLAGVVVLVAAGAYAQPAEPAGPSTPAHAEPASVGQSDAKADHAAPDAGHAAPAGEQAAPAGAHAPAAPHGESHGESIWVTLARIANFAILAGILYWFGRKPVAEHLAARGAQIRKDLVDAAEMRATASARLSEIESKLAALPGELEQMRARSAEELAAERTRIRAAAETERDRLVEQARREIASQTRNARAELRAHAAALAVDVADARLRSTLTPAEQSALVDQYASQMRNVQ